MNSRHTDIVTCKHMSPRWSELIRQGYQTARVTSGWVPTDRIAVMWRGAAARDHVRNVMGYALLRKQEQQQGRDIHG